VNSLDTMVIPGRVVLVIAHPDDESFCSGLLLELVDRGSAIDVLCLTRGEGGPAGPYPRSDLGGIREAELRAACEVLGTGEPVFLDHVDPLGNEFRAFAPAVTPDELASQIGPVIEGADWVLSHGSEGEYWHPAHLLVHAAVNRWKGSHPGGKTRWLTMMAWQPGHPLPRMVNRDDAPDLVFDAGRWSAKRWEALQCHETQLSLFGKFAGGKPRDFIELTAREAYAIR